MTKYIFTRAFISATFAMLVFAAVPEASNADIIPKKLKNLFSSNKDINPEKVRKEQQKRLGKLAKKAEKSPREMAALAEYFEQGFGVKRDRARALELYQKAFAAGDAVAFYQMGSYYLSGLDVDGDGVNEVPRDRVRGRALRQKAIAGIEKLAKKGDGEALYLMGLFHRSGSWGFKKDRKKSRKFFKKGSDKKYPKNMYWYGEILLTEGGKKHPEACNKFHESAIMGYGQSAFAIGYCFEQGRGKPRNTNVAHQWYKYGADKKNVQSIIRMGDIHASSNDDSDKKIAANYYDSAIAEGSALGFVGYAKNSSPLKKIYYYQQALSLDLNNQQYLTETQSGRPKDENGRGGIIGIAPGIYTAKDLSYLAEEAAKGHQGAVEYIKDFMLMGYVKSVAPVTLLSLENGFSDFGRLLYFSADNKTLSMSHDFAAQTGSQIVVSHWDVKTKELISIRVLDVGLSILAASSDGKKLAMTDNTYSYWKRSHEENERLAIYDTATGELIHVLLTEGEETSYWKEAVFSSNDRYLSVTERRIRDDITPYYSFVFDIQTGNKVFDDPFGDHKRIVSPNGQHVITRSVERGDTDAGNIETSYQRVPLWNAGEGIEGLVFEQSVFSPDQRYWVMPRALFDLKEKKLLGEHGAVHEGVGFVNITGQPLLARIYSDAVNTYLMEGATIQKISSVPYDIKRDISRKSIFSSDYSLIATNGVRADSTLKETFIQSYKVPDAKLIAKKRDELKASASADQEMADVLAMFEAGFDEMAVDKYKAIVSEDPVNISVTVELLEHRTRIEATLLGQALAASIEIAENYKDYVMIGAFYKDYEGQPGTGAAIIEEFVLFDSVLKEAGAKIGDQVVAVNGRPVFAKTTAEMKEYRKSIQEGQQIELELERDGGRIKVSYLAQAVPDATGLQVAANQLFWYGLIGNAAGHPDIAEMAANKIESILAAGIYTRYDRILGDATRQSIAMLRAVAAAARGDMKAAYGFLIAEKSMKAEKKWGVSHFSWYPDLFADLHKEPKKLAYILGVKVDDLPKVPEARIKPAPYWTLDGRLIEPGVAAMLKEEGGAIID